MRLHPRGTLRRIYSAIWAIFRSTIPTAGRSLKKGEMRSMASARPNILFILADDLGYADVSCYGRRDFTTPNIDRIAAEGVRFTQAYANSAVCTASRVALITGRYQYRLAVGLEEPLSTRVPRKIGLPADHPTLPSLVKKARLPIRADR